MCCDLCKVQKDASAMRSPLAKCIKCCKNMQEHQSRYICEERPPLVFHLFDHFAGNEISWALHVLCAIAAFHRMRTILNSVHKHLKRIRAHRVHTMQIGKSKAELDCASFLVGMAMRTGIPGSVFMTRSADTPASFASSDFSSKVQPPRNTTRHRPERLLGAGRGRGGARGPLAFLASISAFAVS